MQADYAERITHHTTRLAELLAAAPVKYSDWPSLGISPLRESAGVYHFYEMNAGRIASIYVGKAGFGRKGAWSLNSRLKQHFLPSQKYALLGKASTAPTPTPEQ